MFVMHCCCYFSCFAPYCILKLLYSAIRLSSRKCVNKLSSTSSIKQWTTAMVAYAFRKAFVFLCTGIHPFDLNIFTDLDFMPSTVSDRPQTTTGSTATTDSVSKAHSELGNDLPPATPGTSNPIQAVIVSPEDVRPFTKAAARDSSKKRRKSGKSAIYTSHLHWHTCEESDRNWQPEEKKKSLLVRH